jgi:hypothetical protein
MRPKNACHRIVLAGEEGCRVLYCEDCKVAELEIGAMSLRLEAHAFDTLAHMVKQAENRLEVIRAARLQNGFTARSGNVH